MAKREQGIAEAAARALADDVFYEEQIEPARRALAAIVPLVVDNLRDEMNENGGISKSITRPALTDVVRDALEVGD